jgi:hypothetical protein
MSQRISSADECLKSCPAQSSCVSFRDGEPNPASDAEERKPRFRLILEAAGLSDCRIEKPLQVALPMLKGSRLFVVCCLLV